MLQELRVELYHSCSKSEAASSSLAAGGSSREASQPQDVLLGTATSPLRELLAKPQVRVQLWHPEVLPQVIALKLLSVTTHIRNSTSMLCCANGLERRWTWFGAETWVVS